VISATELRALAAAAGVDPSVVARDYCQGWLLHGLAGTSLHEGLVSKGGTALRKCYFEDYRFSDDLDFTCLRETLSTEDLQPLIGRACVLATERSGIAFALSKWEVHHPGPHETAYKARITFGGLGGRRDSPPKVGLDLTYFEEVVLGPERRTVLNPYPDAPSAHAIVLVYRIEEIVAEKLRCVLPHTRRHAGPRDYYDLWQLLVRRDVTIKRDSLLRTFAAKCAFKSVPFDTPDDFFRPDSLEKSRGAWEATIARQARLEQNFDEVIAELRPAVERLFGGT